MSSRYEVVIGLEVHAQLLTESKLFCRCSTRFGQHPNKNVCPVCLGLPGTLPVINDQAVRFAIRAALAVGCSVQHRSVFARKNYFYPDLPKGYQISQFDEPLALDGYLDIETEGGPRHVGIIRIHMEEDAGKNVHGIGGDSVVDLNRAGVPLVEIVSAPDLRSSTEAATYMRRLRDVLLFLGVNDGNLEEGSLRCDANVSIRPWGQQELGTRCELKNLNSFKFLQRAIDSEVVRQSTIVDSGGRVVQETRSFDPDTGKTHSLRSKEEAHDYRYFPEPDLPPLTVTEADIDAERAKIPALPEELRRRYVGEYGLSEQAAATLTQHPLVVQFFETVRKGVKEPVKAANYILTEVMRGAKIHGQRAEFTVAPEQVAELLTMVDAGEISGKQGKELFGMLEGTTRSARELAAERGLRVVTDSSTVEPLCRNIIAQSPQQVAQYRAGKKGVFGYFVGQVMKVSKGSADPKLVNEVLTRLLEGDN
ncbi:MAG TPA: Asp-tRNA(Asn)/Glu-tRNA(Gln) amidotransferase subunit GatB [Polyangiaceae bacterium]|nr:Asp-tRNA(Asn)/Glu-tRNA(Gln) amidotransferase subunit GatB [Polyangiaceae bacterium]